MEKGGREGDGGGIVLRPVAPPNIPVCVCYISVCGVIQADEIEWKRRVYNDPRAICNAILRDRNDEDRGL